MDTRGVTRQTLGNIQDISGKPLGVYLDNPGYHSIYFSALNFKG